MKRAPQLSLRNLRTLASRRGSVSLLHEYVAEDSLTLGESLLTAEEDEAPPAATLQPALTEVSGLRLVVLAFAVPS